MSKTMKKFLIGKNKGFAIFIPIMAFTTYSMMEVQVGKWSYASNGSAIMLLWWFQAFAIIACSLWIIYKIEKYISRTKQHKEMER